MKRSLSFGIIVIALLTVCAAACKPDKPVVPTPEQGTCGQVITLKGTASDACTLQPVNAVWHVKADKTEFAKSVNIVCENTPVCVGQGYSCSLYTGSISAEGYISITAENMPLVNDSTGDFRLKPINGCPVQ